MRQLPIVLGVLFLSGCTNEQLRRSTIHQAMTLNEIQHRQVMQNLATFAANIHAIPRQVTLKDGTAQITDSGSIVGQVINDRFLNLGASRAVTDLWNMEPVTNDVALKILRIAYRRALGVEENLYTDDLANEFAHELKEQIYQVDDLRTLISNAELQQRAKEGNIPDSIPATKSDALSGLYQDRTVNDVANVMVDGEMRQITTSKTVRMRVEDVPGICAEDAKKVRDKFQKVVSANALNIVYPDERIDETNLAVIELGGLFDKNENPVSAFRPATPLVIELRRQVYETNKDLEEILPGWLGRSQDKHGVPMNACYVAYAKECGAGCYVWVCPDNMKEFEEFTLKIIGLSGLIKETNVTGSSGVKFTPSGSSAASAATPGRG